MDCSKTIDFFAEAKRHCDSRTACEADAANKEQCPMFEVCDRPLTEICVEDAIKAVENLQKWSDEHPKKTYAQDFFEKFPKAQSDSNRTPSVCRKTIYGEIPPKDERCDGREACKNCWNEPMNDEETKGA